MEAIVAIMETGTVTVDDLREAEQLIRRAEGRVTTRRKRLEEEEITLRKEQDRHAKLVEQYRQQHCRETA